jgi:hypothetical protein
LTALARLHAVRALLAIIGACVRLAHQMLMGVPSPRPKHTRARDMVAAASLAIGDRATRLARRVAPG